LPIPTTPPPHLVRVNPGLDQKFKITLNAWCAHGTHPWLFSTSSFQFARMLYACVPVTISMPALGLVADQVEILPGAAPGKSTRFQLSIETDENEIPG